MSFHWHQSAWSRVYGPRIAVNLLTALMKADELISSTTSMCTALVTKQVNSIPKRFEFVLPPRVLRVIIDQGPNASTPTLVKGGDRSRRSAGKSAII